MQITRSSVDTAKGAADWFTGDVYIDAVAAAPAPSRVTANLVHFMPGARTHWHRHPLGQTVFVTEGVGLCQRRGGPVEVIRPGDGVLFEADARGTSGTSESHWRYSPDPAADGRWGLPAGTPGQAGQRVTVDRMDPRQGVQQLYGQAEVTADDVAQVIAFVISRPRRLAINEVLLRPAAQQL